MRSLALHAGVLLTGGAGTLALAHLACGRIGGWVEHYPPGVAKDWDWFAGELLVTEAGGVTRVAGPWRLAGAPSLFDELHQAVLSEG